MSPSDELPDLPPIFVDRCLGRGIVSRLLEVEGVEAHHHDDHFPQDADDFKWIKFTGERGWIGLTHDMAIRNKGIYWDAVEDYGARLFTLRLRTNYDGDTLADVAVDSLRGVQQFVRDNDPGFIASIGRDRKIKRERRRR